MSFISDFFKDITGRTARDASKEAARIQAGAGQEAIGQVTGFGQQAGDVLREFGGQAQGFLDPFSQVGQQGLSQAGFLGDPQAQFEFLQNNPLFQLALENANRTTQASAASRGRLSAGDTLSQLSNNVLLSASPLIDRQRQDILGQLNFGGNIAGQQAQLAQGLGGGLSNILTGTGRDVSGLTTGIGASQAAGTVGAANAMGAGAGNLLNLAGTAFGAFGNPFASTASGVGNAGTGVMNTNLAGLNLFGSAP